MLRSLTIRTFAKHPLVKFKRMDCQVVTFPKSINFEEEYHKNQVKIVELTKTVKYQDEKMQSLNKEIVELTQNRNNQNKFWFITGMIVIYAFIKV
jgi:hypothetical protein